MEAAYALLMLQLEREHAQARLVALHLVAELFARSKTFRALLARDFQAFLDLVVGLDEMNKPLPPPKAYARRLRELALKLVQEWHERFGALYKPVALGFTFLRDKLKIDFDRIQAESLAVRQRNEQQAARRRQLFRQRIDRIRTDLQGGVG